MVDNNFAAKTDNSAPASRKLARRPRGSALPDDVVSAAFEMAAEVSLAHLTMPALARYMDVPVTSIYWHYRRKEQLLDAMVIRAVRKYHFVSPFESDLPWEEGLRKHFRTMRKVFADHPVLCELVLMRPGLLKPDVTRGAVDNLEHVIDTMVQAGFTPENALEVYRALSVYSRGCAIVEHLNGQFDTDPGATPDEFLGHLSAANVRAPRPPAESGTPLLDRLAIAGHSVSDVNFEFTLSAIIDRAKVMLDHDRTAPQAAEDT